MTKQQLENKHLELVSASIITSQLLLHYLEELQRMKSNYPDRRLKNYINLTVKGLIKEEERTFNRVYDQDSEMVHKVSANLQEGIEFLCKRGFSDMMFHLKADMVYQEDKDRVEGVIDGLIKEYNLESVESYG